jgi:hypothetical protein
MTKKQQTALPHVAALVQALENMTMKDVEALDAHTLRQLDALLLNWYELVSREKKKRGA